MLLDKKVREQLLIFSGGEYQLPSKNEVLNQLPLNSHIHPRLFKSKIPYFFTVT